jgi:hypothetical protein
LWRGRLRVFLTGSKYPSVSFAVGLIPFGLVVAAVVTPLASRLTTAATRTEKIGFWSLGGFGKCLGACSGDLYWISTDPKKARRKWRAEGE